MRYVYAHGMWNRYRKMNLMKLYKTKQGIAIDDQNRIYSLPNEDWDTFVNDPNLFQNMRQKIKGSSPTSNNLIQDILPPVGSKQELWACGVTYLRSKIGRQEESKRCD